MSKAKNVHGTGLVLGDIGVLLRGPSGAGKSVLALTLLDRWEGRGQKALLVSDDRVEVAPEAGVLVLRAPASLAGKIELRGRGIVERPMAASARLHLVIDLVEDMVRMLEEDALVTDLFGVTVARAPVPHVSQIGLGHQMLLVIEAIRALSPSPAAA
ncbi:HPr kinase/phosphatase C-terminal domain-containing protein [Devosia sp.]|uniref:HPr kinase/phosphorylase n=1 Tax=Devosia sp. TaxID=1871048 RepID=UPI00326594D9